MVGAQILAFLFSTAYGGDTRDNAYISLNPLDYFNTGIQQQNAIRAMGWGKYTYGEVSELNQEKGTIDAILDIKSPMRGHRIDSNNASSEVLSGGLRYRVCKP